MCGLVIVHARKQKKRAGNKALELYNKQASRGRQGFGYLAIDKGRLVKVFRSKTEKEFEGALKAEKADFVLAHHRMPTSTKNTVGTTHPIFVSHEELDYDYYFAHNGVIINSDVLKGTHNRLGYNYTTEFTAESVATYRDGRIELMESGEVHYNDSESLAIELARWIDGVSQKIDAHGAAAFWGVQLVKGTDKVKRIYFGKNYGRDLCSKIDKNWFFVSSITGTDLKEMNLFSMDPRTCEWGEYKLPMDESKPTLVKQLPSSTRLYREHNSRTADEHVYAYYSLENKYYTASERDATGVAPGEFFSSMYNNKVYFVPLKFSAQVSTRTAPTEETDIQMEDDGGLTDQDGEWFNDSFNEKEQQKLEDLSTRIAKNNLRLDEIDNQLANAKGDEARRLETEYAYVQRDTDLAEEEMSALGVSQETMDECIEFAGQLLAEQNNK